VTTTDIAPLPAPARIGQGTAIEQSRAAAEVQAAVVVAQQCPRNLQTALAEMRQSCAQKGLAERAFYRYSRGDGTVTGASVHLARELARCWGNIQYGIAELRRDDVARESEMQAFAWDVQTNTRSAQIFIVPHKRDTKKGVKDLVDMRDVYENNSNNGARRLRQAIFSILPPWFVEEAKDLCSRTLRDGGGVPLPTRVANTIRAFENLGITVDQLERKQERPSTKWTEHDVAQLQVVGKSIERGETTRDEEFPAPRVTAAEVIGQAVTQPVQAPAPPQPPVDPEEAWLATQEPPEDDQ
jgi:hypothetical protein